MVNKQHFLMQSESGIPKPQTPKENRIKVLFFFLRISVLGFRGENELAGVAHQVL